MMLTAFLGYVLPWGQMSLWAAMVIIQLFSAIPIIGESIVYWIWGGFSIDNVTLRRLYTLHFAVPFLIALLVYIHIKLLHEVGSGQPSTSQTYYVDHVVMWPFHAIKDFFGLLILVQIILIFVCLYPNLLGHWDNYIRADPMVTPPHIVPEWYFLWAYAILRSIPHKLLGACALVGAICLLVTFPWLIDSQIPSMEYRPLSKILFFIWIFNLINLGAIGAHSPDSMAILFGRLCSILYFSFPILLIYVNSIENNS
jgi:ubiquinol-cytochrome c reductase cytochrome b subunit